MDKVFEVVDPKGIRIYCEQSQWEMHIIDRADKTGHPIMCDNIPAIEDTISAPEYIYESTDSVPPMDYRIVYIKASPRATYYEKTPYTKVVASVCGGSGEVVTAYNAKKVTGGWKGEPLYYADNEDKL